MKSKIIVVSTPELEGQFFLSANEESTVVRVGQSFMEIGILNYATKLLHYTLFFVDADGFMHEVSDDLITAEDIIEFDMLEV